jgi:hypothetical protein
MTPPVAAAPRIRLFVLVILIAGGAAFFVGDLIHELIGRGPFGFHLARDGTWQGGLEVLALAALLAAIAAFVRAPRWRIALMVVLAALYLRRQAVDLSMLVDLVFLEILVGLGACAARIARVEPASDVRGYLRLFIAGVVLWSLGAWTLSAFGFGSLKILRLYTLLLAVPAIAARRTPLVVFLSREFSALRASERASVAALGAWFLCLAARTSVVGGFDSWWYGLRGDYVLVAGGSVFKSLGLVAPVHYYPKLYELLLIAVCGLHDTSVIFGVSLIVLAMFALACMVLLKPLGLGFRTRVLIVALAVTVPAIANAALSPKPDLFMAFVLLVACIDATRFAREGSVGALFWIVTSLTLAFASKLSAPPYIIAIAFGAFAIWLRNGRPWQSDTVSERRFAAAIALAAIVVAIFVTARTWLLAGVPLVGPEPLVELFAKLGMTLKPPVGLLVAGDPAGWDAVPELLTDQLFRPQRLDHMVITWIGNVWLYLFAIAVAAPLLVKQSVTDKSSRVPAIWSIVMLVALALLLTFTTKTRGGEGNYFVLPVALAILASAAVAIARVPAGMPARLLLAMLPFFVVSQACYSFISASWVPGTRAFDFDLSRPVRDLQRQKQRIFERAGIANIATYINAVPGVPRGVGYAAQGALFHLDGTFEALDTYDPWYIEPLLSDKAFLDYLARERIDYLIMPSAANRSYEKRILGAVTDAITILRAEPNVRIVEDKDYVLYDLAALHAAERAGR